MEEQNEHVFGFIYDDEKQPDTENHSHEFFLLTWDGRILHTHGFSGITSKDIGHRHSYGGATSPAKSGVPHVHTYSATTSLNDGHVHYISGTTGPAIPVQGGGHIHYFEGITTMNGLTPHSHSYSGRTGIEKTT